MKCKIMMVFVLLGLSALSLAACQAPPMEAIGPQKSRSASIEQTLALAQIARNTPKQLKYSFEQPNSDWHIDAEVIVPEDMRRFDCLACSLGDAADFSGLLNSGAVSERLKAADPFVDAELLNPLTLTMMSAQRRFFTSDDPTGAILESITSAPGRLEFYTAIPAVYSTGVQGLNRGNLSPDGVAGGTELTARQAVESAEAFLEQLTLPFHHCLAQPIAFSPSLQTTLSKGYYQVPVKQMMDGKPIAIANGSEDLAWGADLTPDFVPPITGSWMQVFDYGIHTASLTWFSESFEAVERVERLISLPAAVQIVEDTLHALHDPTPKGNYLRAATLNADQGMVIQKIWLEYAATGCANGRLLLTPCWTFEGLGKAPLFYGIRVNAITGEVLLIRGCEA